MKYKFPSVALNVMAEFVDNGGDCASAVINTAKHFGLELGETKSVTGDFTCNSEGAIASIVSKTTFDAIKSAVLEREAGGTLLPCEPGNEKSFSSCFQKCPLLMDILLQSDAEV